MDRGAPLPADTRQLLYGCPAFSRRRVDNGDQLARSRGQRIYPSWSIRLAAGDRGGFRVRSSAWRYATDTPESLVSFFQVPETGQRSHA